MHIPSMWPSTRRLAPTRRIAAIGVPGVLSLLLAGLAAPAAARAASVTPNAEQPASVTPIAPGEIEEVLSKVPLKDLPTARLSDVLSELPGLSAFPKSAVQEALTKTIERLAAEEGTLGALGGSPEALSGLEAELSKLLSPLELLSILHGHTLASALSEALGSADDRQIIGQLLSSAGDPEQLVEQVLATPGPETLDQILGSTLAGEPFTTGTVGELAAQAGTTSEGLAEDFDTTASQLPANAMALTAPLTNGKTLGVLDAVEGIDLGTLGLTHEHAPEGSSGGSGGAGGEGASGAGAGGSGGSGGGAGGSGGAGGTAGTPGGTILVDLASAQGAATPGASAKATLAKVRILGRKVRGDAVTVLVQVPAAGRLTVAGKGLRSLSRQTDRAERVTLRAVLTRAGLASLRKHRHAKVKLDVSFESVSGASSTAATTVAFA